MIDTRNERASIVNLGLPWRTALPNPDGAVDEFNRMHVLHLYVGILDILQIVLLDGNIRQILLSAGNITQGTQGSTTIHQIREQLTEIGQLVSQEAVIRQILEQISELRK